LTICEVTISCKLQGDRSIARCRVPHPAAPCTLQWAIERSIEAKKKAREQGSKGASEEARKQASSERGCGKEVRERAREQGWERESVCLRVRGGGGAGGAKLPGGSPFAPPAPPDAPIKLN